MVMAFYLGIDGGGTKTKISIIDENENLLFENIVGPSSIDTVSNSTTLNSFKDALTPFLQSNPNVIFDSVLVGIGGIVFDEDSHTVETIIRLLPQIGDLTIVCARSDMETALFSGGNYDFGIALICGTGMVAYGRKGNRTHKSGGWGFKEGELGSAYHLGREAIRYSIRCLDGRLPSDSFSDEIRETIGLNDSSDIIQTIDKYYGQRHLTAQLAKIVTNHANLGNESAKRSIDTATYELALAVKGVYKALDYDNTTLVIIGSLGNSEGYFKRKLHDNILDISNSIKIIEPIYDPSFAAALMAKKFLEERANDI